MRLLYFDDQGKLSLTKDSRNDIPPHAILSHTWGADEDEVDFDDMQLPEATQRQYHCSSREAPNRMPVAAPIAGRFIVQR